MTNIVPGGFIGVDVFYVISGFLITGILLREAQSSGRIDLQQFWAKRLRRLMPALALVIAASFPFALLTISPLMWKDLAWQAIASMTYVSNFLFAANATDYFAEDVAQSPFLHTWSLGVEEQFYVLWPILILLVLVVAKRANLPVRTVLIFVFTATIVASFALSIFLTDARPEWAFYLLPARAWEFAAAGLVAAAPASFLDRGKAAGAVLVTLGLGLLAGGFVLIDAAAPFPGTLAVVPVLGTLLIIVGGTSADPGNTNAISKLLSWRPLQWVGDRSYSWYLWHWPLVVLPGAAFQSDSLWLKIVGSLCSLGLAAVTYRYVENRYRKHPKFVSSAQTTFVAAGTVTAAVVGLAVTVALCASVMTASPRYESFALARAVVSDQTCDRESTSPGGHRLCEMGDLGADETIMLIGDSHAGHWKAALSDAAAANHVRLVVRWMSACPASGLNVTDSKGNRLKGCPDF